MPRRFLRPFRWLSLVGIVLFSGAVQPGLAFEIECGTREAVGSDDFRGVVELYHQGWVGSDEALAEVLGQLGALARGKRTPLVRAYYGSACIAHARMVPDREKRRWLRRGAGELNAAVRAAPEDVQVRLLRAVSFAVLPRMAGQMETVEEDFTWLVGRAEAQGHEGTRDRGAEGEFLLSPVCRQAVFYHAGSFALRNRDPEAVRLLERAAGIDAGDLVRQERVERLLRLAREQLASEHL